jgi:hypothetical protein
LMLFFKKTEKFLLKNLIHSFIILIAHRSPFSLSILAFKGIMTF